MYFTHLARVPEERTCNTAGVPDNYCLCGSREILDPADPKAIQAGKILIKEANRLMQGLDCVKYDQFDIIEAHLTHPKGDIGITLHTKPVVARLRTAVSSESY